MNKSLGRLPVINTWNENYTAELQVNSMFISFPPWINSPFNRISPALKCFTVLFPLYFSFDLGKWVKPVNLQVVYLKRDPCPFSCAGKKVPKKRKKCSAVDTAQLEMASNKRTLINTVFEHSSICPSKPTIFISPDKMCVRLWKAWSNSVVSGKWNKTIPNANFDCYSFC